MRLRIINETNNCGRRLSVEERDKEEEEKEERGEEEEDGQRGRGGQRKGGDRRREEPGASWEVPRNSRTKALLGRFKPTP